MKKTTILIISSLLFCLVCIAVDRIPYEMRTYQGGGTWQTTPYKELINNSYYKWKGKLKNSLPHNNTWTFKFGLKKDGETGYDTPYNKKPSVSSSWIHTRNGSSGGYITTKADIDWELTESESN